MHVGYLKIEREKMSKSLGNVLTVRQLRQSFDPLALRFFMLSSHYRTPINFSRESLEQASKALERLNTTLYNLKERLEKASEGLPDGEEEKLLAFLQDSKEKFIESMDDDFNTAEALAVLFELSHKANIYLNRLEGQKKNVLKSLVDFFVEVDSIFGILKQEKPPVLQQEIEELIAKREKARSQKDWATADAIRDRLREMGIILEDTRQGVRWKKVSPSPKEGKNE